MSRKMLRGIDMSDMDKFLLAIDQVDEVQSMRNHLNLGALVKKEGEAVRFDAEEQSPCYAPTAKRRISLQYEPSEVVHEPLLECMRQLIDAQILSSAVDSPSRDVIDNTIIEICNMYFTEEYLMRLST